MDEPAVKLLPPPRMFSPKKFLLLLAGFLFIGAFLIGFYFFQKGGLVFFQKALWEGKLVCMPIDEQGNLTNEKYRFKRLKVINKTDKDAVVWIQENLCPYQEGQPKEGYRCDTYASRRNDTIGSGQEKIYSIDVPCEKIGQLDIAKDNVLTPDCFNTIDNKVWDGGIAFTIFANSSACPQTTLTPTLPPPSCSLTINNNDGCTSNRSVTLSGFPQSVIQMKFWNEGETEPTAYETFTPSKTWNVNGWETSRVWARFKNAAGESTYCSDVIAYPCPTAIPTPVKPSCSSLTLSRNAITLGQSVTVGANFVSYGFLRSGVCASETNCRVSESVSPATLAQGSSPLSYSWTPTQPGKYVLEINAFESTNCSYLCGAGAVWYRNALTSGGCETGGHWTQVGECSNTCLKYLVVNPAPTLTPTVTPRATNTPTPSSTPMATPRATNTPTPTRQPSITPSLTPTAALTPSVTLTPSPTPTGTIFLVCTDLRMEKVGGGNLSSLKAGDWVRFTVYFSGTASDVGLRIKRGGSVLKIAQAGVSKTGSWVYEYQVTSAGQYEATAFVKSGGVWK